MSFEMKGIHGTRNARGSLKSGYHRCEDGLTGSADHFTDSDCRLLALRPDVTSGVARAAAIAAETVFVG